jgi:FKBP-type peptidyl-prolyl cis-trans isomerase SlyD
MSDIVADGKVVGFHYTLRNDAAEVIDTSDGGRPLVYLHGASNIVPGLERELTGQAVGASMQVQVAPEDGYGVRYEEGVHQVPRAQFPPGVDIQVGMQFGAEGPDGNPMPVWVAAVGDDVVTIDFNHPLAGQTLHFAVEIVSIRDASAEEIAHGHPHGPGGHHH